MSSKLQSGTSWGGIEGLIKAAQEPASDFAKELARPFIIETAEAYSRFLVWTTEQFFGFRASRDDAIELAHQQKAGTDVYICDRESAFHDYRNSFSIIAGTEGTVGPLASQIIENGVSLAAQILADNVVAKRDIMIQIQSKLRQKYNGNLPPADSPPNLDREEYDRVARDFENAKEWRDRFYQRRI